ncbi:MAG: FAD-dependent oxidoreductase [Anaerolineae bacterium]|nr:FAD-dependent oxidoreductase [Anaerolineae bacterium]
MAQVVIIGGGYGGILTAIRLSRRQNKAQITLINPRDHFVERIRLHQTAVGTKPRRLSIPEMLRGTGVHFQQGWVTEIRPDHKTLCVNTDQGVITLPFDYLVYALGSQTRRDQVPGVEQYAFSLDLHSVEGLKPALTQLGTQAGRVLIVGGGLSGIEASAEIAERYPALKVELITQGELGSNLSPEGQNYLRQTLTQMGVGLREHLKISRVEAQQIITVSGETLPYDLLLWTAGFNFSPLAQSAGIKVNGLGQIIVDPELRSVSHPFIYGVGDAACVLLPSGRAQRLACATAMPIAAHAADNLAASIAGQTPRALAFSYTLICISLGRRKGLVQWVKGDDSPTSRITTGFKAAVIKELICRYTILSFYLARRFGGFYLWSQPKPQSGFAPAIR